MVGHYLLKLIIDQLDSRKPNNVLIGEQINQQEKDMMSTSSFTPFGGGQRLCPGLDLARLEASIFLHHLVTSFRYGSLRLTPPVLLVSLYACNVVVPWSLESTNCSFAYMVKIAHTQTL